MISSVEKGDIQRSGVFEENEFGIEENAEMFDILSNKLYADAELAVLREIGCNCYDSHIEAGKVDIPFLVELPNRFSPQLRFRDYGTGIKEEEMQTVYRRYGASTRRNSNNVIGQMGLGAKSPLSLTDSFIVASYINGKKHVYNVFKNEKQIPTLAKLGEEVTTEENGFEVVIAFDKNKFPNLNTKAAQVYQWFKSKPKIAPSISFPSYTKVYDGKDFFIHNDYEVGTYEKTHKLIMGNVSYKINEVTPVIDNTPDSNGVFPYTKEKLEELQKELRPKWLMNLSVVIEVPIGSVDVVPSRENLQYNKKTKVFLETKFKSIIDEVTKSIKDKIKVAKSRYEAAYLLSENSQFGIDEVDWNGQKVKSNAISLSSYCKTGRYSSNKSLIDIKQRGYDRWEKNNWLNLHFPFKFYYDDMDKGGFAAVKREGKNGDWYFKLLKDDQGNLLATKKQLLDILGINESDFTLCSTLPKPTIVRTTRGVSTKIQKFTPQNSYETRGSYWWKDTQVLATDTIYYFDLFEFRLRFKINGTDYEFNPSKLSGIINFLTYFKFISPASEIYGVRAAVSDKMKKGWTNCTKLFEDNYIKLFESEKIEELKKDEASRFWGVEDYEKCTTTNTILLNHLEEWRSLQKRVKDNAQKLTVFKNSPIMIKDVIGRNFEEELHKLLQDWPLCRLISKEDWHKPEFISYLNKEQK